MTETPAIITVTNPEVLPPCGRCRAAILNTWNGRDPAVRGGARIPKADYYVRVKGTKGLHRHICQACQIETGDVILAHFVHDPGARP